MPSPTEFLFGKPQTVQQINRFSPEQQPVFSQLLSQLGQSLGNQDFSGIANEARRGFNEQTVPTILERLTAMGGDRSSAVAQQLGSAGANLESQLAAQRGMYNQRQLQMLLGHGLSPHMENVINPEQQGFIQALLSALAGGAGMGLGLFGSHGASSLGSGLSGLGSILGGLRSSNSSNRSISANVPTNMSNF